MKWSQQREWVEVEKGEKVNAKEKTTSLKIGRLCETVDENQHQYLFKYTL